MLSHFEIGHKWPFIRKKTSVRDELTGLIETSISQTDTEFDDQEGLLLRNMLGLRNIMAEDVMVPRANIVAVDITEGFESVIRQISDAAHSRVPAHEGSMDNVRGMLHIKDLIAHSLEHQRPDLTSMLRPVLFVSPSIGLLDLLLEMRQKRQHLALVVDEFGGIDGLITIENLVEEIVGEIDDEHDRTETPRFEIDKEGVVIAAANLEIAEFEKLIGYRFKVEGRDEIDTLGGLVFSLAGHVPARGEVIRHEQGVEFEILESDLRRIKLIKISGLKQMHPIEKIRKDLSSRGIAGRHE